MVAVEKLPDTDTVKVVIEDPIHELLFKGAQIARVLGTNPENVSVSASLQILMEEEIDGLSKRQFAQARKLAQALQTWDLWKDPDCIIPMTLDEAPPQYQAFVNAILKRSEGE